MAAISFSINISTSINASTSSIRIEPISASQSTYRQFKSLLTNPAGAGFQGTSLGAFTAKNLVTSSVPGLASGKPKHIITMFYATIAIITSKGGSQNFSAQSASAHYRTMPMRSRDRSFDLNHGGRRF